MLLTNGWSRLLAADSHRLSQLSEIKTFPCPFCLPLGALLQKVMYNHGTKKRSEGLYHLYTLYQYRQSHSDKHNKSENPVLAVPTVLRPTLKPSLPTSMAPPNLRRHSGASTAFKKSVFASDQLIHGDAPWNWIQCPHNCSLICKEGNNHPGVHQINGVLPHARHGQGRGGLQDQSLLGTCISVISDTEVS